LRSFILNAEYASSFGAYWMVYGIIGSFASVFMLAKGYDNMHIGMTLAAANLLAFVMQPFIADRMDRAKGIKLIDSSVYMTLAMMLIGAGYFIFAGGSFMLAAAIVLILALHALLQPGLNSLAFRLSKSGVDVSFGIGRAGGSLGFSAIVAVIGTLVEKMGVMVLPVSAEAACLLLIALLLLTKNTFLKMTRETVEKKPAALAGSADAEKAVAPAESAGAESETAAEQDDERIDLKEFIARNRYFFIMNLGVAGLFFSNAVLTNYMAQIAGNVGGTTEQVGRILSLMALLEMPTMLFYDRIRRHFSSVTLIRLASIGFTAKIAVCWIAGSVTLLFAAQFFQLIAFALMMPGMVYYINEIMSPGEAVKGQALFTMMIVLSTIAASFAGGWILDVSGAKTLTFVSLAVTAAGAAVVITTIGRVKAHR